MTSLGSFAGDNDAARFSSRSLTRGRFRLAQACLPSTMQTPSSAQVMLQLALGSVAAHGMG
jgi:hypothetical protein